MHRNTQTKRKTEIVKDIDRETVTQKQRVMGRQRQRQIQEQR